MNAADAFFDTNVLLYLFSADADKAQVAEDLVAQGGRISVQVLSEVANVARRKMRLQWPEIHDISAQLRSACKVVSLTVETHRRGLEVAERFGLAVFDAMIAASALEAECRVLYSEDLQDGLAISDRLAVRNPFRLGSRPTQR